MRLLAVGNPAFSLSPCHLPSIHKCHTQILKFFMSILQIRILYPKSKIPPPPKVLFSKFCPSNVFLSFWGHSPVKKQVCFPVVAYLNCVPSHPTIKLFQKHTPNLRHKEAGTSASGPEAEERSRVPWNISGRSFHDFYIGRQDIIPWHLPGGLGCYYYHPLSSNKLGPHFCDYIGLI